MRKFLIFTLLLLFTNSCMADNLSHQATAFYSDNNFQKTMDLILQIPEGERTAQDWLILGNVLEDKDEKENAIFMYKKALVVDPNYYKVHYNLGNIYYNDSKYNMAIQEYKKALKENKTNSYILYNIACAYIKSGDLNSAKRYLNNAIMQKSDVPEYHYNLAYVYKKLDKPKLAKTYLENYNKLTQTVE